MIHKARGFTLVEITLLVLVAGFMAAVFAASIPVESAEEKAGITVRSTQLLTHFIELYFRKKGEWPDEINGCSTDFYAALATEVDARAWAPVPAGGGPLTNGWGEAVEISCTTDVLTITQIIPQPEMRAYIANQLAHTSLLASNKMVTSVSKAPYIGVLKVIRRKFKENLSHVHSKLRYKDFGTIDPDDVGVEDVLFNCPGPLSAHVHSIRMPSICAHDKYILGGTLTSTFDVRGFNIKPDHYSSNAWHYVLSAEIAAPGDPSSNSRGIDLSCGSDTDYLDFVVSCKI